MKQVIRVIDPNFTAERLRDFEAGGKRVLSLLRAKGFSKTDRDKVRTILFEEKAKLANGASMKRLHDEISRHGNPLMTTGFGGADLGVYNPDTIPIETYKRMQQDPQIAIGLAMIKMPIYSLGWSIECEDHDVREFVEATLSPIWRKLIRSMLTAVDYGFASHEKVWELKDLNIFTNSATQRKTTHFKGKGEVYKKIKPHYPSTIRILLDKKTDEFSGIIQKVGYDFEVKLDANKCFLFSLADDFGNYFGNSRLKPAYKSWYWKEVLTQFMLRYYERRGSPSTVVQHPPGIGIDDSGTEFDNSEMALRIGQSILENSVVTMPFMPDKNGANMWKLDYLQDEKRGEMFVNALNYLGSQCLRGLIVPERVMTQDLATGSYGIASSHAEIFLLSEEGLIMEMEDAINTGIIPDLVTFNFKPQKVLPCYVRIEKIQYDRKRILKEVLVEVMRNMNTMMKEGHAPALVPSISEMGKVLGVPLREFAEEYSVLQGVVPDEEQPKKTKRVPLKKDENEVNDEKDENTINKKEVTEEESDDNQRD